MSYLVIQLGNDAEGHIQTTLGNISVELVTRYNYQAGNWTLDILDATGSVMVAGLSLLPNVDLLRPYPDVKAKLGGMMVVEQNAGDYVYEDLLGFTVQLLWFPIGTEVAFP